MHNNAGLYIHIPFCAKKCAYCNFYSVIANPSLLEEYTSALIREIKKWGGRFDRPIDSVYIGGGTPSLLGSNIISVMNAVRENFNMLPNAEITSEVNPEFSDEFLLCAKQSGINRISMGIQSGRNEELEILGRGHTVEKAILSFDRLRKAGFDNISLDLMLGLPNSSIETLKHSLDVITKLSPRHISAYMLKIEEKTAFWKRSLNLPDDEETANQYLFMCDYLRDKGYNHYEISNFAKKGYESRHNLKYWRLQEYLGIGPSAHSLIADKRYYYKGDIKAFIKGNEPVFDTDKTDDERIMLGLRISDGVSFSDAEKEKLNPLLKALEKEKFVKIKGNNVSLTEKGMLVSNSIITEITEIIYENL